MAHKPPRPMPAYADALSNSIAQGDIAAVRAHFDKILWGGNEQRPTWAHLKIAVQKDDVAMARLLVTWGARAGVDDLGALQKSAPKKYPEYLQTLRRAGHGISPKALREGIAAAAALPEAAANESLRPYDGRRLIDGVFMDPRAEKLPREWRQLLQNMQANGAPEAIIAGGALRDLFNERAIKDVDIFLQNRGSEKKNRKFLEKVFAAASLPVHKQIISGGYDSIATAFPDPSHGTFVQRVSRGYATIRAASNSEAWTVIAGPQKTEYNVIFIDGPLGESMKKAGMLHEIPDEVHESPAQTMIRHFDFGLCQIGFDGGDLHMTDAYQKDIENKTITLQKQNGTSAQHLQRIVKKYPDFKLCDESQKVLNPPKPARQSSSGYGSSRSRSSYGGWSSY